MSDRYGPLWAGTDLGTLRMDPWRDYHLQPFTAFLRADPEAARACALGEDVTDAGIEAACRSYLSTWEEKNYGPYAVYGFSDAKYRFMGFCGPHDVPGVVPPIWSAAFTPAYRGFDVSRRVGTVILSNLRLQNLETFTLPDNHSARAALAKNPAWHELGEVEYAGKTVVWYKRDPWTAKPLR